MRTVIITLSLTLMAPAAFAQSKASVLTYAGAASADLTSTYVFLQHEGYREANPLGRWLDDKPTALIVYSAACDTGAVWAAHKLVGKRHPKLLTVTLYSLAAVRVGLAVYNYRTLPR